jgi:hypothetical protein
MQCVNIPNNARNWRRFSFAIFATLNLALALNGCAGTGEDIATEGDIPEENLSADTQGNQDPAAAELDEDVVKWFDSDEKTATATQGLTVPGGSWIRTCPIFTVGYNSSGTPVRLGADCYNRNRKLVYSQVNVTSCSTRCFWNNNGRLTCGSC